MGCCGGGLRGCMNKTWQFIKMYIRMYVLGFAMLAAGVAAYLPYWFRVSIVVTDPLGASTTTYVQTLDCGLIYMFPYQGRFIDWVFMDKASNTHNLPPLMRIAQVFFLIGVFSIILCVVASVLFVCKRYKSVTGELLLAGGVTPSAICLTLSIICAVLSVFLEAGKPWFNIPYQIQIEDQLMPQLLLRTNPTVTINFGLYVGAVAAFTAIVGSIIAWAQACSLCTNTEEFRYQMLRDPRFEDDFQPSAYGKPTGGMYHTPGRQPNYGVGPAVGFGEMGEHIDDGEMDL